MSREELLALTERTGATKIRGYTCTSGGTTGCLDATSVSILQDDDISIVVTTDGKLRFYTFDSSSTTADSDPDYIRPDDYSTAGVHILVNEFDVNGKISSNSVLHRVLSSAPPIPENGMLAVADGDNWSMGGVSQGTDDWLGIYRLSDETWVGLYNITDGIIVGDIESFSTIANSTDIGLITGDTFGFGTAADDTLNELFTAIGTELGLKVEIDAPTANAFMGYNFTASTPANIYPDGITVEIYDDNGTLKLRVITGSIPMTSSTNPTVDAEGEFAWDSDDEQIRVYDGSQNRAIPTVFCETIPVLQPDLVQVESDDIILKHFDARAYPFGVKILGYTISGGTMSDTHVLEEWDDRAGTTQSTSESITIADAQRQEDDGTLSDADFAPDSFLNLNLDDSTDDISQMEVTIIYYIKTGD